ncbi:MAG: hypothetical protein ABI193_22340 [Minicystis sp.]
MKDSPEYKVFRHLVAQLRPDISTVFNIATSPKTVLSRIFQTRRGIDYVDAAHAIKIIENVTNLTKLDRVPSFARFRQRLGAL